MGCKKEDEEQEESSPLPEVCCKANTAKCKACSAGISIEAFCKDTKSKHIEGCKKEDEEQEESSPLPEVCCKANTAKCKACSAGISIEAFCNDSKNVHVDGCWDGKFNRMLQEKVLHKIDSMEST